MARRAAGGLGPYGDDFSFVSPLVKYVLFFFNMLFWVSDSGTPTPGEDTGDPPSLGGGHWGHPLSPETHRQPAIPGTRWGPPGCPRP